MAHRDDGLHARDRGEDTRLRKATLDGPAARVVNLGEQRFYRRYQELLLRPDSSHVVQRLGALALRHIAVGRF